MTSASRLVLQRACWSFIALLLFGRCADGAELPTPEQIVAQAGKACESLKPAVKAGRQATIQERLESGLRQRAWQRLALARVNLGDFEGAVEALNQVNSDPRFSRISVQAMRTELTGIVPPWPDDLPTRLKETQKSVLADILRKQSRFDAALEMARDMTDERTRSLSTAQAYLARSRSLEKTDRLGALKDQVDATEAVKSIRDAPTYFKIYGEICRGQIRLGPPEVARIMIEAVSSKLKEAEGSSARADVIQEWARIGELFLLAGDDQGADRCFAHARELYGKTNPRKAWDESLPHQLTLHYRCHAYRENNQLASIPAVLAEWERAFSKLTDPEDIAFAAPYFIRHEIQSDRFDQASTVIQALEAGTQGIVVQKTAEDLKRGASSAQKARFARFVKGLHGENVDLHLPMLIVAAELFDSAGDSESADALIDEATAISRERKKDYRALIAGWLAENGRFQKCYDLIQPLDDPKQRAQALAELAFQMTSPKKPQSDAGQKPG
ncbi:MAG: hypothetical protein HY290_13280 [Planctomycetia bacterium]|nr:hypothetical protein [Planctomycetia bacterium]